MPAPMRIDVALPVPVRSTFTYEVPEALRERAVRGVRVRVPFGERSLVGVVLGRTEGDPPSGTSIKSVQEVLDDEPVLPAPVLELTLWLADYYQAPQGEAVRLAISFAAPRAGAGGGGDVVPEEAGP